MIRRLRYKDLRLTGPPEPNSSILHCGICGVEIHRVSYGDVRWPDAISREAQYFAYHHYEQGHPLRFRLWQSLRWKWLVRGLV